MTIGHQIVRSALNHEICDDQEHLMFDASQAPNRATISQGFSPVWSPGSKMMVVFVELAMVPRYNGNADDMVHSLPQIMGVMLDALDIRRVTPAEGMAMLGPGLDSTHG